MGHHLVYTNLFLNLVSEKLEDFCQCEADKNKDKYNNEMYNKCCNEGYYPLLDDQCISINDGKFFMDNKRRVCRLSVSTLSSCLEGAKIEKAAKQGETGVLDYTPGSGARSSNLQFSDVFAFTTLVAFGICLLR